MIRDTSFLSTDFGLAKVAAMVDKGELGLMLKFESTSSMGLFWEKRTKVTNGICWGEAINVLRSKDIYKDFFFYSSSQLSCISVQSYLR